MPTWGNSDFVWGDFTWGAIPGTYPNILYGLQIDWDGDGIFSGENDAQYMQAWSCERGRDFLLNSSGAGLEPVAPGTLTLTLDNNDGRYDPFAHANIVPGRKIQLMVEDVSTLTNHDVFTGEIDDIRPYAQDKTVVITAVDAMRKLSTLDTTIALNADIKISDAIEAILDSVAYTEYDVDALLDIIAFWWVNQEKATDAIQKLCDASWGTFFIAADGKAKYHKRQRAVSSVLNLTQDVLLKDIGINTPWDVIRNNIDVIVNPLVQQNTSDLWTLRDQPTVLAGQTIELWGSFSCFVNC